MNIQKICGRSYTKKRPLDLISLVGMNKIIVDKLFEEHNYKLEDYECNGDFSYGVYRLQSCVVREIRIKFKVGSSGDFVDTIIIG